MTSPARKPAAAAAKTVASPGSSKKSPPPPTDSVEVPKALGSLARVLLSSKNGGSQYSALIQTLKPRTEEQQRQDLEVVAQLAGLLSASVSTQETQVAFGATPLLSESESDGASSVSENNGEGSKASEIDTSCPDDTKKAEATFTATDTSGNPNVSGTQSRDATMDDVPDNSEEIGAKTSSASDSGTEGVGSTTMEEGTDSTIVGAGFHNLEEIGAKMSATEQSPSDEQRPTHEDANTDDVQSVAISASTADNMAGDSNLGSVENTSTSPNDSPSDVASVEEQASTPTASTTVDDVAVGVDNTNDSDEEMVNNNDDETASNSGRDTPATPPARRTINSDLDSGVYMQSGVKKTKKERECYNAWDKTISSSTYGTINLAMGRPQLPAKKKSPGALGRGGKRLYQEIEKEAGKQGVSTGDFLKRLRGHDTQQQKKKRRTENGSDNDGSAA